MRELEATIVSECGRYMAEIKRLAVSAFQISMYKWTEENVPGIGKVAEFWESVGRMATFTDTIERAENLARDELRRLSE